MSTSKKDRGQRVARQDDDRDTEQAKPTEDEGGGDNPTRNERLDLPPGLRYVFRGCCN